MAALTVEPAEPAALEANVGISPAADPEDLLELDVEFHRLIGVASGNRVLASLIVGLSAPTNRARVWRGRTQPGSMERTVLEHFVDPVRLRGGRYLAPNRPGFSAEMKPQSLQRFRHPDGPVWTEL